MVWDVRFPMYVLPEVVRDMRQFWADVKWRLEQDELQDLPDTPGFDDPLDPDNPARYENLWLVQYCSFPYLKTWRAKHILKPLACFDYDVPHAGNGQHASLIVVAAGSKMVGLRDLQGKIAAVNNIDSNTGMNLLRLAIAPYARESRFFHDVLFTGAHEQSLQAVAEGKADVAAIDAVTFAYVQDHRPELAAKVRVLEVTRSVPTLPLFTAVDLPNSVCDKVFKAFASVIADGQQGKVVRERLHIRGILPISEEALDIGLEYEAEAAKLGYPLLT